MIADIGQNNESMKKHDTLKLYLIKNAAKRTTQVAFRVVFTGSRKRYGSTSASGSKHKQTI